jgi:predicted Fe-Mo cluster-binding NifX family protein
MARFFLPANGTPEKAKGWMKVAIPRYRRRISPRFGFTEDILVVEVGEDGERSSEILPMDRHFPDEVPELLFRKGVQAVLTGGINLYFQSLFRTLGIEVIWGLIGRPEDALEAFLDGHIRPGMGRCPAGRRRQRHRGGPFWG